jgi:hypothetical protein
MKKLLFALFITTLCTNKVWSEEIHSPVPALDNKTPPTAAPAKKHWWNFGKSKTPAQPSPAPVKSQGLSKRQIRALANVLQRASYGGAMGMQSFNEGMRSYNYYPNYPTGNYRPSFTATTYPSLAPGGSSTAYFSGGGSATTYPSLTPGGASTTYFNGF